MEGDKAMTNKEAKKILEKWFGWGMNGMDSTSRKRGQ
jgi:hypothetical protein